MIDEIVFLKSRKDQLQELIAGHKSSLRELEEEVKFLDSRIDNTVVDGLRMKVREFIPSIQRMGYKIRLLRRPAMFSSKQEPWLTGNPNYLDTESGISMEITEDEAIFLSSQAGRQVYNIDCSVWDTYRYPGEVD